MKSKKIKISVLIILINILAFVIFMGASNQFVSASALPEKTANIVESTDFTEISSDADSQIQTFAFANSHPVAEAPYLDIRIVGDSIQDNGIIPIHHWSIDIKNTNDKVVQVNYNKGMCLYNDAKNWTGLKNIEYFYLDPGDHATVVIGTNWFATSIAISWVDGNDRYVTYADKLGMNGFAPEYNRVDANLAHSEDHYLDIQIIGKQFNYWIFKVTNTNSFTIDLEYNTKMCFMNDARNWTGLNDVNTDTSLGCGESKDDCRIYGNFFADAVAFSFKSDGYRYITFANHLDVNTTMTVETNFIEA